MARGLSPEDYRLLDELNRTVELPLFRMAGRGRPGIDSLMRTAASLSLNMSDVKYENPRGRKVHLLRQHGDRDHRY
jgi:hypothetical protein